MIRDALHKLSRRRYLQAWVVAGAALVCMAASLPSEAGMNGLVGDPARLRLPQGSLRMSLGTGMQVHGLPLRAEVFQTATSLRETIDLIASQPGVLPSLLMLPGAVLLAWQSGRHHWLAYLTEPGESLTRGTVSVLTLPDVDAPLLVKRTNQSAWLPAHAKLLFTFDGADAAQRMRQDVYAHDLPPSKLWRHIRERLRQTGWRRKLDDSMQGVIERWSRGPHTLTLLVAPVSAGSGMLVVETGPT